MWPLVTPGVQPATKPSSHNLRRSSRRRTLRAARASLRLLTLAFRTAQKHHARCPCWLQHRLPGPVQGVAVQVGRGGSSGCSGCCAGVVGDAGVRAVGQNERLFVGMILILIFGEALALYGLIVSLIMAEKGNDYHC